jgi:hypothetical protein
MFRIVRDPDDRHREDDQKGDKQASADYHLRRDAPIAVVYSAAHIAI